MSYFNFSFRTFLQILKSLFVGLNTLISRTTGLILINILVLDSAFIEENYRL